MKLLFILLFSILSFSVSADDGKRYSFQFNDIRLPELVRLVYSEVLRRSYVIDTPVLQNNDIFVVHLTDKSQNQVKDYILALLDSKGFQVKSRGAIDFIAPRPEKEESEKSVFVYRPLNRSVSYLIELVSSFFPNGNFSHQRGIQTIRQSQYPVTRPVQSKQGRVGQMPADSPVTDNLNSAYSMIDKSDSDVIVFNGVDADIAKLEKLLQTLDKPVNELLVKAMVYEVRSERAEGSALTLAASILSGRLGVSLEGGLTSGNTISLKFNNFEAVYAALSGDKRFKLVSSPTMRVQSGASARFTAGAEVPVLGNVTYQQQGQAVQSVDYKSSGVILDIKPSAREQKTDLEIFQQISSFVPTTTGVNQTPTLLKRELQTKISSSDDEMIVLGGLEETQTTDSEQGFSFLPAWMRTNTDNETKTEILVILNAKRI